jgi:type IV secretory pathway VirD2 relaxase
VSFQDDELPIFRPKRRAGLHRGAPDSSFRLAVLSNVRTNCRAAYHQGVRIARARIAVRRPGHLDRRVIVKARFVSMSGDGVKTAALHLRYIERDGVERDGSPGRLYGAAEARPDLASPMAGERHQFRLIISPEDAKDLDLTAYIREYMRRVERDVQRPLIWGAVNHYDTDNPHAHVIIRGVDADAREVRFDRAYISHGLRHRAQELATEELGLGSELDITQQIDREVTQGRFTSLDWQIARRERDGRVEHAELSEPLRRRMRYLESVRLAERVDKSAWHLREGWSTELRAQGERGDILKQMQRALQGDAGRYEIVRRNQDLPASPMQANRTVYGRVVSKGLADESKGTLFAVVESASGTAYYVPLWKSEAERVVEGNVVALSSRPASWARPIDSTIASLSSTHGGRIAEAQVDASMEARLRELRRLGLAQHGRDGEWQVRRDFEQALRAKDKEAPRHRVALRQEPMRLTAQVGYIGPVWLDRVAMTAPFGFGAEVRRLLEQRDAFLRSMSIPAGDKRLPQLQRRERERLAAELAKKTGRTVRKDLAGFEGRIRLCDSLPNGNQYAEISDGKQLCVVPADRHVRGLDGQHVALSFEARKLVVKPRNLSRDLE